MVRSSVPTQFQLTNMGKRCGNFNACTRKVSGGPPLRCKPAKNLPTDIEGDTYERAIFTIPDSDIRIQNNIAAHKIYKAKSETDKCSD